MTYRLERIGDRRGRRAFVDAPRRLMGQMPAFVPPLTVEGIKRIDPARNPFFHHAESAFWLLYDGARIAGRISATVDRLALEWSGDGQGVFGHFLAPDAAGARLLLDAARGFLREHQLRSMLGPVELSSNYTCGLQVTGFDVAPFVDMNQHPPGQEALLLGEGLVPAQDLLALRVHRKDLDLERFRRMRELAARRFPAELRQIDMRTFNAEVEALHEVYLKAWERNFAFVPMSREEFFAIAADFRKIVEPTLCHIARRDGKAIGFILGLPNVNEAILACDGRLLPFGFIKLLRTLRRTHSFRTITLGVIPECRGRGLDSRLILELIDRSAGTGYDHAELSWVLEDNIAMVKPLVQIGGREVMRHRLYVQALAPSSAPSAV